MARLACRGVVPACIGKDIPVADILTHSPLILRPDPSRTVIRPFDPGDPAGFAVEGHSRAQRIADRVLALDDETVRARLSLAVEALGDRHRDVEALMLRRFDEVSAQIGRDGIDRDRKLVIGAYFSEEYSFEAAALFNPSMALHHDQSGLAPHSIRFVLALRGIGEGHVSSVTFRTGTWGPDAEVAIDPPSRFAMPPMIEPLDGQNEDEAIRFISEGSREISETVLFPMAPSQRQGIEDLRLCNFTEDDGTVLRLGTYTAFSGSATRSEMLLATDHNRFEMRPMRGAVEDSKGTALFPRRIDGRYALLGRQDSENLWLLTSDDRYRWEGGMKIVAPRWPWEYVQIGNCGSPIEIDEGWLVLTHGVGMVRGYCIGACLLDKRDPAKLLARTTEPLLRPSEKERDGYVPNVVYSCGALVHERTLLLPYGVADNFTAFASASVDDVLAAMA